MIVGKSQKGIVGCGPTVWLGGMFVAVGRAVGGTVVLGGLIWCPGVAVGVSARGLCGGLPKQKSVNVAVVAVVFDPALAEVTSPALIVFV